MANGTDIAKAYVQIIPSAEGIKGKLEEIMGDEADRSGKSAGSKFGSAFGGILKAGGLAVAGFATATAAMTGALIKGSGELAEYGDHIDKMSQKMGLSATAYQEWDAILQHSGTSIDTMKAGMKTLANAVESGNGAFERIGLTMEEVAGMNNEELFAATIAGLQNVENETERTYLAGQLLGRGATELGALLNTSAEETEAMRQRVHELGGVMSDEAVKASAAYQDSLQDMRTALDGAKRGIMTDFLPSITQVMDGLTELFSGGDGITQINEGISSFVDTLSQNMPRVMEVGSEILLALTDAIVQNLPTLLDAGGEAIMTIATGLIENLPSIIETGLEVLVSLAQGIADNLPELIPTIVDVVLQIVDTLTQPDTLSSLVDASIAIIVGLAEGLIEAIPQLLEKAPEIVGNLVDAIVENAPKLLKAAFELVKKIGEGIRDNFHLIVQKGGEIIGKVVSGITDGISRIWDVGMDIVRGIWKGISDGFGWIKEKISGWIGNVMDFIKGLFGIKSPSKWAENIIGLNIAKGIGVGFVDGIPAVEQAMRDNMPQLDPIQITGKYGAVGNGYGYGPAYNYGGVTIVIEGRDKDAAQLARELQTELTRRTAGFDPWRQPA